MDFVIRPLEQWSRPPTEDRKESQLKANWTKGKEKLSYELGRLGAEKAVIQLDVTDRECRQDGWARADARVKSPRVAVAFEARGIPLIYRCDDFVSWEQNDYAIGSAASRPMSRGF